MKAIKVLFAVLFVILTASGSLATDKKNKPEIKTVDNYVAVFDFEVTIGDKGISRPLADSVIYEFSQSDKYEVIDRGNMNKILEEQKFQMSGCVAQESKVEAGQILGVGKIVSGSVGLVGNTYFITLQLIDAQTVKIDISVVDKCKCELDELPDSTMKLAKKLIGEKNLQPSIASTPVPLAIPKQPELQPTFKEPALDCRFIVYDNGTVLDTKTNLMWAAKDNENDINWANAKKYCENYRSGGYTDWRMPTLDELFRLFDNAKTYKAACGYDVHLTESIRLSCYRIWTSETEGSAATSFAFDVGLKYWSLQSISNSRVLPVRSGK